MSDGTITRALRREIEAVGVGSGSFARLTSLREGARVIARAARQGTESGFGDYTEDIRESYRLMHDAERRQGQMIARLGQDVVWLQLVTEESGLTERYVMDVLMFAQVPSRAWRGINFALGTEASRVPVVRAARVFLASRERYLGMLPTNHDSDVGLARQLEGIHGQARQGMVWLG